MNWGGPLSTGIVMGRRWQTCVVSLLTLAGCAEQADTETGLGFNVAIELGLSAILRYHQVDASILIEICQRRTALLAVNHDTGFVTWNGRESAAAVAL